MNRIKGLAAAFGMAALLVVSLACGGGGDEGPEPVTDYRSLVDSLRSLEAKVGIRGFSAQSFFIGTQGRLLDVNNEDVRVFQFRSVEDADAASGTVSADGSSIGTTTMSWDAPPHFYKGGILIVLYVGSASSVVNVLEEAMGPQFAGQ